MEYEIATYLDSSLDSLNLDRRTLVKTVLLHIDDFTTLTIYTKLMFTRSVFSLSTHSFIISSNSSKVAARENNDSSAYPQTRQNPNRISTTVLNECPRNDFHCLCDRSKRPPFNSFDTPRFLSQPNRNCHLGRTTSGSQSRIENDVTSDGHRVGEVSVDFVEDIFRGSSEEDCTGFGILTFR